MFETGLPRLVAYHRRRPIHHGPAQVLDHRKFWDAMHAVSATQLAQIEQALAVRIIGEFGIDIGSLALDMTNFATFIDSANPKAPIAQRGKAKQKRTDLRLVGLGAGRVS